MSGPDPSSRARRWLQYAEQDLELAQVVEDSDQFAPRHACFQAQQSVEKAIKGALVFSRIGFPRTHDIQTLFELIPNDWRLRAEYSDLSGLTPWAVEARYPGDWLEPTAEDADSAVALARKVVDDIVENLVAHGYRVDR